MTAADKYGKVCYLGGSMYGDGDYVVEFRNVASAWAPVAATLLCPDGSVCNVDLAPRTEPSVQTARHIIALARREDR